MKTCKLKAYSENERISTQALLQMIYKKIDEGFCDFEIDACGQHDIAGALSAKNKKNKLNFKIKNPGQRVGAMALSNTEITVLGSASADVGWLNSGALITVLGDAGDTAGHCAASGKIYIAGSTGTRSGALMKYDPKYAKPELWVLKNTGSFSFEFMGGGVGVICGLDCENLPSVLGSRACVGMVGGTIYFRGSISDLDENVEVSALEKEDKDFLKKGLKEFLAKIGKDSLYSKLTIFSKWKKITPKTASDKKKKITIEEFRKKQWFKGGLFGDLIEDDNRVCSLIDPQSKLRKPFWNKKECINCSMCLNNCPQCAIKADNKIYTIDENKCIGCSICACICPKKAITIKETVEEI